MYCWFVFQVAKYFDIHAIHTNTTKIMAVTETTSRKCLERGTRDPSSALS